MKILINLTNFMEKGEIYSDDRIVLDIGCMLILKGYEVVPFIIKKEKMQTQKVNPRLFAEYYFKKTIMSKALYIQKEPLDCDAIASQDILFDIDNTWKLDSVYEEALLSIVNRGVQVVTYIYSFDIADNNDAQLFSEWITKVNRSDVKIFVADKNIYEVFEKRFEQVKEKIEMLPLSHIVNNFDIVMDYVDNGVRRILENETQLWVCESDNREDYLQLFLAIQDEKMKEKQRKKLIYLLPSTRETPVENELMNMNEIGNTFYAVKKVNYHTVRYMYQKAKEIYFVGDSKEMQYEREVIKNMKH